MAGIRLTGLTSGLDTEALVKQLSDAHKLKIDKVKKQQTRLEWKKEAWKGLNTKLMNFYKGALSTFKSVGTYNAKSVKGELSGVTITTGTKAAAGRHKVEVKSIAGAQMWTGHQINKNKYTETSYVGTEDGSKKISELYDKNGYSIQNALNGSSFTVKNAEDGSSVDVNISVDENTTVDEMLSNINAQLADTGVTASFEKGALKFTNTSATELVNDATGDKTYSGGHAVEIIAKDQTSAKELGIAYDENGKGTTIKALSDDNKTNSALASTFAYEKQIKNDSSVTGATKLTDLGIADGTVIKVKDKEIIVDRTTTLSGLANQMAKAGINANYDADQGRFYLSAKDTGTENGFTVDADADTLSKLGLDLADGESGKIAASDATIVYNGVEYSQSGNNFSINGLSITATAVGAAQEFTVETDLEGIYDKVKSFVKEYNELIGEMNKLYGAESSRGYEPLTSDEKEAMNEEDIKNWETKIKDSLLRRDSTISSLLSGMRTVLNKSVEVANADGTTSRFSLSSFGIVTGNYMEKGQLHIQGNKDDADFSGMADKLMAALTNNPDALAQTFSKLGDEMYKNFQKAMKKTELSSALTFYNDKQIDGEIKDYKDDVKELEKKLADEEEKYYKQFSAMETALAKLQSQQSYIGQLFGGMQ